MPQNFKFTAYSYCTERANFTKVLKTMSYAKIEFTIFRILRNIVTFFYEISYTLPR